MADLDKVFRLLGMANRARKITFGMSATHQSLLSGRIRLLLLASDIAQNTKDKITAAAGKTITVSCADKDALGRVFGRNELAIIGIEDDGFAKAVLKSLS